MKLYFPTYLILFLAVALPVNAQDEGPWLTDYKEAVKMSEETGKPIFTVFTGTDWIEICEVFYDEILTAPEFYEPTSEAYVLLLLEYPKNNRMAKEGAAQLQLLKDAYRVRGFPTVIMTDSTGRPFGMNGYQPVTPAVYAEQSLAIAEVGKKRFEILKQAESLEGIEKAIKLVTGIPELPGNLSARYYQKEMEEVMKADPENTLEQTDVYRGLILDVEYSNEMQRLARDVQWGKMIEVTEAYIKEGELTGDRLQKALLNMADVQNRQANLAGRVNTLLNVMQIDPESGYGKEAERQLAELRAKKLQEDLAP